MKINYTMFSTGLTGGVRVLLEIANGLSNRGHDVTITSLGNEKDHNWISLKAKMNYVHHTILNKAIDKGIDKSLSTNVSIYHKKEKLYSAIPDCEINIATYCFTAFSVFASGKGNPFYHMQHYEPLFFNDKYQRKLAEGTYYLPLNKIVNSIWLKNQMKEKYDYDLPVVNPAIDHSVFYPRDFEKDTNKLRIACFGKQTDWKGFKDALDAMKIVMKNRDDIEFVVYGAHQPTHKTKISYRFVKYPSDDELAKLYSSSDIVICPSWYESFPLPPIEAMACGAPVVTTRYGTEDYAFDGKNSLVVLPRNPNVLADSILKLLNDQNLRESFKKEGPKTAKQFTWDKTVDKVEELFQNALKNRE
jgi:glycosyltransferase involved in cell wall biosynthesis